MFLFLHLAATSPHGSCVSAHQSSHGPLSLDYAGAERQAKKFASFPETPTLVISYANCSLYFFPHLIYLTLMEWIMFEDNKLMCGSYSQLRGV